MKASFHTEKWSAMRSNQNPLLLASATANKAISYFCLRLFPGDIRVYAAQAGAVEAKEHHRHFRRRDVVLREQLLVHHQPPLSQSPLRVSSMSFFTTTPTSWGWFVDWWQFQANSPDFHNLISFLLFWPQCNKLIPILKCKHFLTKEWNKDRNRKYHAESEESAATCAQKG